MLYMNRTRRKVQFTISSTSALSCVVCVEGNVQQPHGGTRTLEHGRVHFSTMLKQMYIHWVWDIDNWVMTYFDINKSNHGYLCGWIVTLEKWPIRMRSMWSTGAAHEYIAAEMDTKGSSTHNLEFDRERKKKVNIVVSYALFARGSTDFVMRALGKGYGGRQSCAVIILESGLKCKWTVWKTSIPWALGEDVWGPFCMDKAKYKSTEVIMWSKLCLTTAALFCIGFLPQLPCECEFN